MKLKLNVGPGVIIFTMGFCGLLFSLAQKTGENLSKVVLAVFFIIIIGIGIWLEIYTRQREYDVFGEFEANKFH